MKNDENQKDIQNENVTENQEESRDKKSSENQRENQQQNQVNNYIYVTGFFGGLFVSVLAYAAHFINFIPFGPGVVIRMWPFYPVVGGVRGPWAHVIGILVLSLLSILIAWVYHALFRKINTVWAGLWFGLALWVVIFFALHPLVPGVGSFRQLDWNTNITILCLFLIYGLFVGYSISYEHLQEELEKQRN